jgi:hypothetical protein
LVLVSAINSQFTADLFDKRSNDPHSQSFAGDGIESLRQGWTIIGNRQRVAFFRIGFQADRDPACTVFDGVRDQFVGEPSGMAVTAGRVTSIPSTTMTRSGHSEDSIIERSRQRSSRYCLARQKNPWRRISRLHAYSSSSSLFLFFAQSVSQRGRQTPVSGLESMLQSGGKRRASRLLFLLSEVELVRYQKSSLHRLP